MAFHISPVKRAALSALQGSSRTFVVRTPHQIASLRLTFAQTSAPRCSRRQVLVELLDDVNGLGQMCE